MLQQRQVGALFGLFVRTIGAARFVRVVAPVAALVAVASIPLPRAASQIDLSMPSSGLVQMLAVARGAASGASHDAVLASERPRHASMNFEQRLPSRDFAGGSPASRIGERWLQLRAEQRAMQKSSESSPRHVGERLLHATTSNAFEAGSPASTFGAFALLGDAVKPVASTGAEPRAPPDADEPSKDASDPQPAPVHEVAQASPQAAPHDHTAAMSEPAAAPVAAADPKKVPPDTVSPLKLSPEQRNISRFVARRYRVDLDDVQRFVAHAYRAAGEFRLDPYLVLAVMSIESSFNPNARSSAGAQGLMQVLTRVHLDKFAPFGGARAALDPVANISVGSRILKEYLVREGSVEGALKSYVGAALLPHDFGYGNKVLSERARIAAAARDGASARTITAGVAPTTKIAMADPPGTMQANVRGPAAKTPAAPKAPTAADAAPSVKPAPDGNGTVSSERPAPTPAQASEPRASSNAGLAASIASREL